MKILSILKNKKKTMENTNLQMNGTMVPCSAFGLADAQLKLNITYGIPPYKIELKVNDNTPMNKWNETPFFRVITDIPVNPLSGGTPGDAGYNCIITDLPTGGYRFRIYDSTTPVPQMNLVFADWLATSPPYVTLNGTVNPLGISTTVSFEVGETLEYDKVVQAGILNGIQSTNVLLKLNSGEYNAVSFLKPNTLYNYRIKATNVNGTSYGANMTFTTPPLLPIVVTLPATNIK